MTESPQEHVERLQRELADAKVAQLQQELAQAQQEAGGSAAGPGYQLPQGYQLPPLGQPAAAQPAGPMPGWQPPVAASAPGYPPAYPAGYPPGYPAGGPTGAGPQVVFGSNAFSQLGGPGSAQRAEFVESVLNQVRQFGDVPHGASSLLTADLGSRDAAPGTDRPLSAPPRKVPLSFRAAMLPWKWWDLFTLFMVAVAPIALWIVAPASAAATGIVVVIALLYFRFRGLRTRMKLLKWGVVAQVRSAGPLSVGTYYSGTTYQNVRLPVAHGWTVDRSWYSGPGYKTKIVYAVDGVENELILHGREYDDGVILANSRKPEMALCVSQFAYDLNRDQNGDWVPHVGFGLWFGSVLQAVVYIGYLAVSIYLATIYWPPLL